MNNQQNDQQGQMGSQSKDAQGKEQEGKKGTVDKQNKVGDRGEGKKEGSDA